MMPLLPGICHIEPLYRFITRDTQHKLNTH
nr:MAG TPA: hypothetical protein [Caudoviricetes sp.]